MRKTIFVRMGALALAFVLVCGLCPVTVSAEENSMVYSSAAFEEAYTYTGDDLGAVWSTDATTFRV